MWAKKAESEPGQVNLDRVLHQVRTKGKVLADKLLEQQRAAGADIHPNNGYAFIEAVERYAERRVYEALAIDVARIDMAAYQKNTDAQGDGLGMKIALMNMSPKWTPEKIDALFDMGDPDFGSFPRAAEIFKRDVDTMIRRTIAVARGRGQE